jgi:Nuclease-related domain
MRFRRRKTRSPVPHPSLPNPGQSSQFQMEDRWEKRVTPPLLLAAFMAVCTAMEWTRHLARRWPSPWFFTALFLLSAGFCAWRIWRTTAEIKQRHQGMRGERIVGQMLEDLRSLGCKVYHDICEDGFNIDHVVIGPYGVFAVETKAPSKPQKDAVVAFDGETVTVAGFKPDRDPIKQARANARRVQRILGEMTGVEPFVTPVVLYVNWWVETYTRDAGVIVMNHNYFFKSFDRLRDCNALDATQVNVLASGMERYLRSKT